MRLLRASRGNLTSASKDHPQAEPPPLDCAASNWRSSGIQRVKTVPLPSSLSTPQLVGLRRLHFAQPPLEKSALAVIGDQRQRSRIALRRFYRGSGAAQQIGARSMQQVIAVEIAGSGERIDERAPA